MILLIVVLDFELGFESVDNSLMTVCYGRIVFFLKFLRVGRARLCF